MSIFDRFLKRHDDTALIELQNKFTALESQIAKSNLNDSLVGIINGNWHELEVNKVAKSYENHYTINRGINLLADNIAELPLRIYRGSEVMPEEFVLPGGFDLDSPHPTMSLNELMYQTCVYYFYRGEFMVYINLENSPLTLEPVNPRLMKRISDSAWKWNNSLIIPNEQLILTMLFNPDGDRGLSPVDVVKEELLNDQSANDFSKKFFENFAQLGGKLYDELGHASKDDMQTLVDQFNKAHSGSKNAHKTLGLPKGIKYQQDIQTMKEMDFLSSRKDIRDRILAALGIHKAVFGVTDQVDRAVADAAMRQLWTQTLRPKAIRIQEKFNQSLMKKYFPGYTVKFDFSNVEVLQENRESRLTQAKLYKELGYTTNEINDLLDLDMDEITEAAGSMRFVPSNLIPVEGLSYIEETPEETPTEPPPSKSLDKIVELLEEDEKALSIDKARKNYIRNFTAAHAKTETHMNKAIRKYFSAQLREVTKIIRKSSKASIDTNTLLSEIQNFIYGEKKVLQDLMRPEYEAGAIRADKLALAVLNKESIEAAFNPGVIETLVNRITGINNETYKLLRNQILEGVQAGEAIDDIAKRVRTVYDFNVSRSRIIARTESAAVMNRSTDVRYKEAGIEKKTWVDAGDSNVRQTHSHNSSVGTVPYDYTYDNGQKFPNDGNGGAGENINCRCVHVPVIE